MSANSTVSSTRPLSRAWAAGAGPGDAPMVADVDSTMCEVHGYAKEGAAFGYTAQRGYHPIVATRDDTGEVLDVRLRKGSSQRGHNRFVEELTARLRRCGAAGELIMRFDSGFWSKQILATLERLDVRYTMAVRTGTPTVKAAIAAIAESDWVDIAYTPDGVAQVAETAYTSGRGRQRVTRRLIVRRTRLAGTAQQALWPDWRHHGFSHRPRPTPTRSPLTPSVAVTPPSSSPSKT